MAKDPNRFDTVLRRGDCWSLVVTWQPGGNDIDMTGYSAEFAIIWPAQYNPSVGNIAAGEINSNPVIDPTQSTVTVSVEDEVTATLPLISAATYQLRVEDPDGCKTTIAVGSLRVEQDYIDG